MSFNERFPHFGIILVLAVVLSIPLTIWSLKNAPTQTQEEAAQSSTIVLNENPSSLTLGSWVDFTTTLPKNYKSFKITVGCYSATNPPNGAPYDPNYGYLVYQQSGGVTDKFQLGSGGSIWQYIIPAQSTTCHGTLYYLDNGNTNTYLPLVSTPNFVAPGNPNILPFL